MNSLLKIVFVLFLCLPLNALAELPDQLIKDFSPISGTLIMPMGDEFMVDLDAVTGLQQGDILTLTAGGEQIMAPATNNPLNRQNDVIGYLSVTQIKSGYSYCRLVRSVRPPQNGDKVQRFVQVPARIGDTLAGSRLADEFRTGLSQLHWLDDQSTETAALLTFSLVDDRVEVIDSEGTPIKSYDYINGALSATMTSGYSPGNFSSSGGSVKQKSLLNQTVGTLLGSVGFSGKDKRLENPGIIRSVQQQEGKIWIGPDLDGNPVGLTIADFDRDGRREIAVATQKLVKIYRLENGRMQQLALIDFPGGVIPLSLDSIDLDHNGFSELYLTANNGIELSSQMIAYENGAYQLMESRIPWFLRVVELPGEGRVLLGQSLGSVEEPFSQAAFRVRLVDGKPTRAANFPLPPGVNLLSFVPLQGQSNELLYATLDQYDYLTLTTAKGTQLFTSTEHYGGTEEYFYNVVNPGKEIIRPIYIQKRLLKLPSGEILVPQNDGPRLLDRFRDFGKNRIMAMNWDGFALVEAWSIPDQAGYLADFALADADNDGELELVTAVKFRQNNLLQQGHAAVVIYELNQ